MKFNKKFVIIICIVVLCVIVLLLLLKNKKKYKVEFIDGEYRISIVVEKGDKINEPVVPDRKGYVLTGWYNNNEKYDYSRKVNSDLTLVSKFEKKKKKKVKDTKTEDKNTVNNVENNTDTDKNKVENTVSDNNENTKKDNKKSNQNTNQQANSAPAPVPSPTPAPAPSPAPEPTPAPAPVSYSYEMVDVAGSVTGQAYIYIKANGNRTSGTATINYTNGLSETVSISAGGYMIPNKSAIASVSNIGG